MSEPSALGAPRSTAEPLNVTMSRFRPRAFTDAELVAKMQAMFPQAAKAIRAAYAEGWKAVKREAP